jgi:hypothetical protein
VEQKIEEELLKIEEESNFQEKIKLSPLNDS